MSFLFDTDGDRPPIEFGLALALIVATVLFRPVARRLRVRGLTAWLLLAATGAILAVTLTPSPEALRFGATGGVSCDLSRLGPASLAEYRRFDDPTLNVLMFIPLGMVIGVVGRRPTRVRLALAALLLSPAIELTQALVVPIGRACQGGDLFDNTLGLAIGLALGWGIGRVWRMAEGPRREDMRAGAEQGPG